MNDDILKIALQLARMYGVAETLNPVKNLDTVNFINMILEWTDEYIKSDEKDIIAYFDKQFQMCKKKNKEKS